MAAMTWRIRWEELSGEERRKADRKKNRRDGGGGWFAVDSDGAPADQMNPLLDQNADRRDSISAKVHTLYANSNLPSVFH